MWQWLDCQCLLAVPQCFIPIMSHTITDYYKRKRQKWCNRSGKDRVWIIPFLGSGLSTYYMGHNKCPKQTLTPHAPRSSPCLSFWLSPPPVFRSPSGRKLLIIVPHQIHLCPPGRWAATKGRGVETPGWKITIAHRAGQWKSFPLDFFAGGGRPATTQTQSLALSSAYS